MRDGISELVGHLRNDLAPDVVNLPNSLLLGLAPAIKAALRSPLCCTLQGEDFFLQSLNEPYRGEALALMQSYVACVDMFVAVSEFCAAHMAGRLRIPEHKIRVARLGISMQGFERRSEAMAEPLTVGYLARIAPEKGLHLLCQAYRELRRVYRAPTRLWAAGYMSSEQGTYMNRIRRDLREWGLEDEFHYWGELDRRGKIEFLRRVHVFSVPCTYDEPKGIFLLEAMAAGLPVVQPRRGVFPEIVARTGGGVLAQSGDPVALAQALLPLCENPSLRRDLGDAGFQGVRKHFTSTAMAADAVAIYKELLSAAGAARGDSCCG
jgi:glycosyltransferase involved in cell wall biosynthesis